jgi:hypothetical protein
MQEMDSKYYFSEVYEGDYSNRTALPEISSNTKFSPVFDDCIGAVDGSHLQ